MADDRLSKAARDLLAELFSDESALAFKPKTAEAVVEIRAWLKRQADHG